MSRWLFLLPLVAPATAAVAQSLSSPESVEFDASGNRWLISNRGAGQLLSRASNGALTVFSNDPASPAGIEIHRGLVYVADGARVRAYRLADGVREVDHAIAGASFLNGIASDGASRLWVSDFNGQDIHQLDLSNLPGVSHTIPLPNVGFTPNGLHWDAAAQRLLIVTWGSNARVYAWRPGDAQPALLIQTSFGNFDGVALDCEGALYVSSWSAQAILRAPPPLDAAAILSVFAGSQSNPADIHYAAATGEIGVPNAGSSTFAFVPTACLNQDGFESP